MKRAVLGLSVALAVLGVCWWLDRPQRTVPAVLVLTLAVLMREQGWMRAVVKPAISAGARTWMTSSSLQKWSASQRGGNGRSSRTC